MPVVTEGKTLIEAIENAKNELKTEKIYYKTKEEQNKLFQNICYKVEAISYKEMLKEIEKYIKILVEGLGLQIQFDSNVSEEQFYITMFSDNNNILIGRNGGTLKALETLTRAKIYSEWNVSPKVILDVENYREKRIEALERIAIKTANEVKSSKISVTLENMNSFERRIVHNRLSNFKGIITMSEGEEPNRHIIIKAE